MNKLHRHDHRALRAQHRTNRGDLVGLGPHPYNDWSEVIDRLNQPTELFLGNVQLPWLSSTERP